MDSWYFFSNSSYEVINLSLAYVTYPVSYVIKTNVFYHNGIDGYGILD